MSLWFQSTAPIHSSPAAALPLRGGGAVVPCGWPGGQQESSSISHAPMGASCRRPAPNEVLALLKPPGTAGSFSSAGRRTSTIFNSVGKWPMMKFW